MAEAAVAEDNMNKPWIIIIIVGIILVGGFFVNTNLTGNTIDTENLSTIKLQVAIPCGGHASLIRNELYKVNGIENIEYTPITMFLVYYNPDKLSEQDILDLDIFKEYPAKKIN
ncbi:MAG: hypothetical protein AABX17_03955 [Nanoarchaeota archaeon]